MKYVKANNCSAKIEIFIDTKHFLTTGVLHEIKQNVCDKIIDRFEQSLADYDDDICTAYRKAAACFDYDGNIYGFKFMLYETVYNTEELTDLLARQAEDAIAYVMNNECIAEVVCNIE